MNKVNVNKATVVRIVIAVLIMVILIFPIYQLGIMVPTFLVKGKILIDIRFIISGVLFILALVIKLLSGNKIKNYSITNLNKMLDVMADKFLVNLLLIALACNSMINVIVVVLIISADTFISGLWLLIGNNNGTVDKVHLDSWRMIILSFGLGLTLFYNLPFELFNIMISDFLLVVSAVLSVLVLFKYWKMAKPYLKEE